MDVMIDIETMGSTSRAVIASIGAVVFDPHLADVPAGVDRSRVFYTNIELTNQRGREFNGDTVRWWLEQSEAARIAFKNPMPIPLTAAMQHYSDFLRFHRPIHGWSLGATFDHVILQDAFDQLGWKNPINHREQLCMRTITRLSTVERPTLAGTAHNALDDALLQAHWLQLCLKELRERGTR